MSSEPQKYWTRTCNHKSRRGGRGGIGDLILLFPRGEWQGLGPWYASWQYQKLQRPFLEGIESHKQPEEEEVRGGGGESGHEDLSGGEDSVRSNGSGHVEIFRQDRGPLFEICFPGGSKEKK
jgi:hypothetical protein